jgi:hypothetical protein
MLTISLLEQCEGVTVLIPDFMKSETGPKSTTLRRAGRPGVHGRAARPWVPVGACRQVLTNSSSFNPKRLYHALTRAARSAGSDLVPGRRVPRGPEASRGRRVWPPGLETVTAWTSREASAHACHDLPREASPKTRDGRRRPGQASIDVAISIGHASDPVKVRGRRASALFLFFGDDSSAISLEARAFPPLPR